MKHAYDPGPQAVAKGGLQLHRNENLFVPPALLQSIAAQALSRVSLHAYPDARAMALREGLATLHRVRSDEVFVGNGSDEVLACLFHHLRARFDTVVTRRVGYLVYPLLAERFGYRRQAVEQPELRTELAPALFAIDSPASITGEVSAPEAIATLSRTSGAFVIWDNAYGELAGESLSAVPNTESLVKVRSFSKYYGLASARVGYALAPAELVRELDARKDVFNVSGFSQALALAALGHADDFAEARVRMLEVRGQLVAAARSLGFEVREPSGNFVLLRSPGFTGAELEQHLASHQIVVRRFALPEVEGWVRITVPVAAALGRLLGVLSLARSQEARSA